MLATDEVVNREGSSLFAGHADEAVAHECRGLDLALPRFAQVDAFPFRRQVARLVKGAPNIVYAGHAPWVPHPAVREEPSTVETRLQPRVEDVCCTLFRPWCQAPPVDFLEVQHVVAARA